MKKFLYILRKYLYIVSIVAFAIWILVASINKTQSATLFAITLLAIVVTYIIILFRPKKEDYAKNGEKWQKKYEYTNTTESTKNHKDGSFEIYYIHHFKVSCTNSIGDTYEYDLARNGGVSGKDKNGKTYSKKIPYKLFLKNIDALEDKS